MLKKDRYKAFVDYFSTHNPDAETELNYGNPYELLVAVILSAQCTDKRINQVTPALFERFPDPESLAASTSDEVFTYIRSVSYPNNKAKHLVGMGKKLVEEFNSVVPEKVEDLVKLPGVGRKTANVISSVVYHNPAMAVDTHVFRVSNRLGLTSRATTPLAAEKQLVKNLPKDTIAMAHHWLILHGRYICVARKPKCEICPITYFCKYFEQKYKVKAVLPATEAKKENERNCLYK
ncbi:endonuclease III [Sphingobacterium lactis]|uniref:endonuclease III n=1 Tax=Sphingobacterium lactis TaxID=797291 RepID=UPI003F7CF2C7